MSILTIGTADSFRGDLNNEKAKRAFARATADVLNIEWRRLGVPGARVVEATWSDATEGKPAVLSITTAAGKAPITIDDVRAAMQTKGASHG